MERINKNPVKILVMDVDGTLTDGKIYIGENGEVFKAFNIKDGLAIREILTKNNILPVIITGRVSKIVENRAAELGVIDIYQGVSNKLELLGKLIDEKKISFSNTAFIGDDINDLECMKCCGFKGCPADAAPEIKNIADFVSAKNGGDGAVREFIEVIIKGDTE
jgi:3-deoxy-D-manno-octulosonate 8-phosphate phosphatase (KDO 8-P phosphatase)